MDKTSQKKDRNYCVPILYQALCKLVLSWVLKERQNSIVGHRKNPMREEKEVCLGC